MRAGTYLELSTIGKMGSAHRHQFVPSFSLIISAPSAIRKVFAGAPCPWLNCSAYSFSNISHGTSSANLTHRFSPDNFPPNDK